MILKEVKENGVEYLEIDSSMISNTSYDSENATLTVKFKRGGSYEYSPISKILYENFKKSESQGKFLISNIKNNKNINFTKVN